MKRRFWSGSLALGTFAVVSCGEDTAPTAPAATAEPVAAPSLAATGSWTTRAPMPTGRSDLAAAVVNNSLGQPVLYAIGGFNPNSGFTRAVEAYNFATDQWSTKAPLPLALLNTNGAAVIAGKVYVSGGAFETAEGLTGLHPGLNVYDPIRNRWSKRADMPRRFAGGVSGVINGKLYVLMGNCNNCGSVERITSRMYRYDPATNMWEFVSRAPHAHASGAGAVINGKFYVAGGTGADGRASSQLDVYDPATDRWTTLAPMPSARTGVAGAALQGMLYVVGKANVEPGESQGETTAYNPQTNTWITKAPMSGAGRGNLAAAAVRFEGSPHLLAVGGDNVEGLGDSDQNQAFTP